MCILHALSKLLTNVWRQDTLILQVCNQLYTIQLFLWTQDDSGAISQSQSKPWIHSNNISKVCLERVRYRIVDVDLWIWNLYFSPFNFILYWCVQRTTTDSWSSSRYWLFLYLKSNDGIFEIKSTHWILVHCLMNYGPESCVVNKNNCSAISSKLRDPVKFIQMGKSL